MIQCLIKSETHSAISTLQNQSYRKTRKTFTFGCNEIRKPFTNKKGFYTMT